MIMSLIAVVSKTQKCHELPGLFSLDGQLVYHDGNDNGKDGNNVKDKSVTCWPAVA